MRLAVLPKLHHDPAAAHLLRHRACRSRSGEGIEDPVTGFCGHLEHTGKETFGLRRVKRYDPREKSLHLALGLLGMSHFRVGPPGPWHKPSLDLAEVELHSWDIVAARTKDYPAILDHPPKILFHYAPVAPFRRLDRTSGGCRDRVHQALMTFLGCEDRSETPGPAGIVVWIPVLAL